MVRGSILLLLLTACVAMPHVQTQWTVYLPLVTHDNNVKRGIALVGNCSDVATLGATWYYNWSREPILCENSTTFAMVAREQEMWQPFYSTTVLSFNEPNFADQASLTQAQVALFTRQMEESEFYANVDKWISPAIGNADFEWLSDTRELFYQEYGRPPKWWALAYHCYSLNYDWLNYCRSQLARYIEAARLWDAPGGVWITEFAVVQDAPVLNPFTRDQALVELRRWVGEMNADPGVTRYAYFTTRYNDDWGGCAWLNGCSKFSASFGVDGLSDFGRAYILQ